MGFFDESSSEDEKEKEKRSIDDSIAFEHTPAGSSTTTKKDQVLVNEEDAEEDPLDAYMNSLNKESVKDGNKECCSSTTRTTQRIDCENDDSEYEYGEVLLAKEETDDTIPSQQMLKAKQAMMNEFRKAKHTDFHSERSSSKPYTATPEDDDDIMLPNELPPIEKSFWQTSDTAVGRAWRREHQITLSYFGTPNKNNNRSNDNRTHSNASTMIDPILSFDELVDCFGKDLLSTTKQFSAPTLVQAQTLPIVMAGYDAVITAATGQGKTMAYLWPAAVHCDRQKQKLSAMALVLVPTRELALQVQKQSSPLFAALHLNSHAVIGGQGRWKLLQELDKATYHLIVATPGRLLDVASVTTSSSNSSKKKHCGITLDLTSFVVLDEADKLLQMGFEDQVRKILHHIKRPDRQTLLLSATMGRKVEQVAHEWLCSSSLRHALRISVGRTGAASTNVQQHVMIVPDANAKEQFVMEMLPVWVPLGRTIIFVATREGCERLVRAVRTHRPNITVETLHGDKHQSDRTAAVKAFTKGKLSVLIASDVASRGLDIPNVQTVLSLDPAKNLDAHVHRVGRAGRLSKDQQQIGSAYTLLTTSNPKDADFAVVLRNAFQREEREISTQLEELANRSQRLRRDHVQIREKGNRAGLGYEEELPTQSYPYGPTDRNAPLSKRTRWS